MAATTVKSDILIAPVSGACFPVQIAELSLLFRHQYQPDISLGCSGGAIASFLALISNYKESHLIRNSKYLSSELFKKDWTDTLSAISYLIGFCKGSLYHHSEESISLVKQLTTRSTLRRGEIWIHAYETEVQRPVLFCTKSQSDCQLKITDKRSVASQIGEVFYLDGDVDQFSLALRATSSIPLVVPRTKMEHHHRTGYYVDGGIYCASPVTLLSEELSELAPFHLIYLSSNDLERQLSWKPVKETMATVLDRSASSIVNNKLLQDRNVCYNLLSRLGPIRSTTFDLTGLDDYFKKRHRWRSSLLEIYPDQEQQIELTDFTPEQVIFVIKKCQQSIKFRLWYVN